MYFLTFIILASGIFMIITSDHLIKKIIGLSIFQNSIVIFFVALGKTTNGSVPILYYQLTRGDFNPIYSSPLPHVLMLTAIVVGFATISVGLALIYQIYREYDTLVESKINNLIENIE